ncbi:MAG: 1-deoxy-D-xylulose-5-phosphate synthase [Treponema sp.]|nr:1-deoxy-D-xylulose-5-phosphate synthase [Treponema sp.]
MIKPVKATIPTRRSFAERMKEYGKTDPDFAVFESDIGRSTYSYLFGEEFPGRYFNFGIAEMATLSAAAGMAAGGRTVMVCGYGVFISMRAIEVIRSFICYPNLNVKFLSSHAGLSAAIDGVTHQATEDIAFMTTLPNMTVLAPCDTVSAARLFDIAVETPGPVYTRLMREPFLDIYDTNDVFVRGGSHVVISGRDVTIAAYGDMVFQAMEAAEELSRQQISAEVLDMYSIKPFDWEGIKRSVEKTGALLVVENHQKRNGLAYDVGIQLLKSNPLPFDHIGLDDCFAESGEYLPVIDKYGISSPHIVKAAKALLEKKSTNLIHTKRNSPR